MMDKYCKLFIVYTLLRRVNPTLAKHYVDFVDANDRQHVDIDLLMRFIRFGEDEVLEACKMLSNAYADMEARGEDVKAYIIQNIAPTSFGENSVKNV